MAGNPARVKFVLAWLLLLAAKLWLAAHLQPFGDEAFYVQESRRLAWAYSDLPGLTAWLIRLGQTLAGPDIFAARLPFVLLGAALPWGVARIAARGFGESARWPAAWLALLMPLSGLMGVLALPDVPLLLAALLCLDAFLGLLSRRDPRDALQLALALALGAFAHYRFAPVLLAGAAGLLGVPAGRALLREPRLWVALAVGAAAWLPLLAWNLAHDGAGIGFQFRDRHPWVLHAGGALWPLIQAAVVTPLLFLLLLATLREAWRRRADTAWGVLLGAGGVATLGYAVLGFFADADRVSFHWPLAGWLALCAAAPTVLAHWPRGWRMATLALAAAGVLATTTCLALLTQPAGRAWLARGPVYADNFSGWTEAAAAVRAELATMPPGSALVADNFMLGAQLSLALGRDDVAVLSHPLNGKHGRAVQLAVWGLLRDTPGLLGSPRLVVVEDTARPGKDRLRGYRHVCAMAAPLAPPRVLNVDGGRKRFLLFRSEATTAGCAMPALSWIERPAPGEAVSGALVLEGWALVPEGRVRRVEVLLDGEPVANADYGHARRDVLAYWGLVAPDADVGVGWTANADVSRRLRGTAWLSLRLHLDDGSVQDAPGQVLRLR